MSRHKSKQTKPHSEKGTTQPDFRPAGLKISLTSNANCNSKDVWLMLVISLNVTMCLQ